MLRPGCRRLCAGRGTVEPHGRGQGRWSFRGQSAGGSCAGNPRGAGLKPPSPAPACPLGPLRRWSRMPNLDWARWAASARRWRSTAARWAVFHAGRSAPAAFRRWFDFCSPTRRLRAAGDAGLADGVRPDVSGGAGRGLSCRVSWLNLMPDGEGASLHFRLLPADWETDQRGRGRTAGQGRPGDPSEGLPAASWFLNINSADDLRRAEAHFQSFIA